MGNILGAEEAVNSHSRPTTLVITGSEQQSTGASQSQDKSNPIIGLPIYLFHGDKGVIQPLNVPARNAIAHKSPALVKHAVAEAFQRRANKVGFYYEDTNCAVRWKPSAIPFHIEFEISVSNNICQHLASVRNIKAKDPDQYAKSIVPLAKLFLTKAPGTHLPHLPFTRLQVSSDNRSNRDAEDKRTTETIEHARLISGQYDSLTEIDITTAEATARMVNAGKIFSGLLVYLMSPKPRIEDTIISTEPPTIEDKGFKHTERPLAASRKRLKSLLPADELQGFGPVVKHKRVVFNSENDFDPVMVTGNSDLEENNAPKDTSAIEKALLEEPAAAIRSSKGGKASKKDKQRGKKFINERTRSEAISTVSAYPTQRPPRKKPARKSITTREASLEKRLGSEAHDDIGQGSPVRPLSLEGLDHEEKTPERWVIPEESSQKDHSSPESASGENEEPQIYTAEEVLDPERIATDPGFGPIDVVNGEDLITTADKPVAFSIPTKPRHMYGSRAQGLLWTYAANPKVDETLSDLRVWLWKKPKTHFRTQSMLLIEKFRHSVLAPVIVSHERTGDDEPIIEFDGYTVQIVPHEQCWEDVRSHESHPDFLVPWKLAEYQASEAAGYQVWRHDRDLLECRKSGCDASISDYHLSTIVCLGCGPKSVVRYCSLRHQLEDVERHWRECGNWRLVLQRVIDHTTAPSKFALMWPAIKQRHGSKTAALHRQMLYSALTYGHYTLFDSASSRSETLCWSKQDSKWPEMDRRVERLLNIAFFDSWNHYILGYLYRLLRELLRSRGAWSKNTERSLKFQLEAEFSNYKVNTNWHNGDAPCECEWSGRILPRNDHLSTCWEYSLSDDHGPVRRQKYIKGTVEDYEERFWILRAWRQQHSTQNNWRLRAAGHGFAESIPDEDCYELGPGWTGWGGEKDNVCEDLGMNQGEKRIIQSA
ncbi:MAG: hypothetical protein ALECFALPRED_001141 [Alectoria fallacina]|uniref:Rhodanese domain-containing protein n=1 Tax=Alectoria fallacina TaxID=1903189 RepID=A0A8H3F7G8_9LECA|nr:MAG: hypothetical protein ALECFALPRED_001141 [Alectoria fallacina]